MRFSSAFVVVVSVAFSANVFALPILSGAADGVALVRRGNDTTTSTGIASDREQTQIPPAKVQGHKVDSSANASNGPSSSSQPRGRPRADSLGMTMAGLPANIADPTTNRGQIKVDSSADGSKAPSSSSKPRGRITTSRANSLGMTMAGLPVSLADPTPKRQVKSKAQPKGGLSAKAADAAGGRIAFSGGDPYTR